MKASEIIAAMTKFVSANGDMDVIMSFEGEYGERYTPDVKSVYLETGIRVRRSGDPENGKETRVSKCVIEC